jgi:hypothetical protein
LVDDLSQITLISQKGELFGHIAAGGQFYELYPLGGETYALVELDRSQFTEEECATLNTPAADPSERNVYFDHARCKQNQKY